MNTCDSTNLPSYKNPPVSEVACGLKFENIDKFKVHHLGLFWQIIQEEFPVVEHAVRLESDSLQLDFKNYLPRAWFIRKEKNRLIQLQDDMFYFNWRRIQDDESYPRYSTIIEDFKKNLSIFQQFLKDEELGVVIPKNCELTYINHIPKEEGWESIGGIGKVFRDINWCSGDRFLPAPSTIGGQVVFEFPQKKGKLSLILQQVKRKSDEHIMLVLRNSASGLGEDKNMEAVWEWFEMAHEWIVRGFTDITAPEAQNDIWQREEK